MKSDSKLWAFLAYLLGIIGFILVLLVKRTDKFAMYHAKQSLVLFIAGVIINVAGMVPIIGWFVILPLGAIFLIVLWIIGMINAITGKEKALPLIGQFGEKIKL